MWYVEGRLVRSSLGCLALASTDFWGRLGWFSKVRPSTNKERDGKRRRRHRRSIGVVAVELVGRGRVSDVIERPILETVELLVARRRTGGVEEKENRFRPEHLAAIQEARTVRIEVRLDKRDLRCEIAAIWTTSPVKVELFLRATAGHLHLALRSRDDQRGFARRVVLEFIRLVALQISRSLWREEVSSSQSWRHVPGNRPLWSEKMSELLPQPLGPMTTTENGVASIHWGR